MSTEMDLDTEFSEELFNESASAGAEADDADSSEKQIESVTVDEVDEEDDDEDADRLTTTLPLFKIKKIMRICTTNDDEDEPEEPSNSKSKGKKKGKMILSKESILLTTVATECFVAAIAEMAGRITASTKKKTMTLEHLKTALSDSEAFEFLQGCLQPSVIIGD